MRPRRTASSRASRRPSVGSMTARVIASRSEARRVARFSSGWRSGGLRWRVELARAFCLGGGIVSVRWTRRTLARLSERRARFELARVVVERVEQQLLGAGLDELV